MTEQGPTLGLGVFLTALSIVPILLLSSEPWHTIAIATAITMFVTGFSFTMVGTRYSRPFKNLGILLWSLTQFVVIGLLIAAIFVR